MLSDLIRGHIQSPRNMGVMESPDGAAEVVGPACGDRINLFIKVCRGRIAQVRFTTHGCWAAVAMCSYLSELATGKSLDQALDLGAKALARDAAGLPEDKLACAELAGRALAQAIADFRKRGQGP